MSRAWALSPPTSSSSTTRSHAAGRCARRPAPRAAGASSTASPGTEIRSADQRCPPEVPRRTYEVLKIGLVSVARFELATPSTPRTCATRLRYTEMRRILPSLPLELVENRAQLALNRGDIDAVGPAAIAAVASVARRAFRLFVVAEGIVQAVARTADGEPLLVEELADAADEQHLMVLVVTPIAAALHGLELREFLFPIAQHVRLYAAELAYLTDGEVALRRDGREFSLPAAWLHAVLSPPRP